jgi:16S rRNA (cytosine1402-N4)-methyltransferase
MRMDRRSELSAFEVVNNYSEDRLRQIIFEYGEERFARNIVRKICERRQSHPIESTGELVEIIKSAIPAASRENGHHPAKRTFQAIRIEVNGELDAIAPAINDAVEMLDKGGRIAVITFHSLEDRIVKQAFAQLAQGCICPKDFPVCVCGKKPTVSVITRKPILPSKIELEENPRSRSAKLRIAEKI